MSVERVEQADNRPTSKVNAATAASAGAIVIVFVAKQFNLEVDAVTATALGTLLTFVGGYFRRERA